VGGAQVGQREVAAADAGLVRDHDDAVAGLAQRGHGLGGARQHAHLLGAAQVVDLADQHAVAVEEDGRALRHAAIVSKS
jgi:hypothetical protein